jgi:hypothetical protein
MAVALGFAGLGWSWLEPSEISFRPTPKLRVVGHCPFAKSVKWPLLPLVTVRNPEQQVTLYLTRFYKRARVTYNRACEVPNKPYAD